MIFKPDLIEKILAGEKTETRRKVKPGETCRYVPGRTYALQPGRGMHSVGRIKVTEVYQDQALWFMDQEDAEAEGFASVQEFRDYWIRLYGSWNPHERVHVIEFKLLERVAVYADE